MPDPVTDYTLTITKDGDILTGPQAVITLTHDFTPNYNDDEGKVIGCTATNDVDSVDADTVVLVVKRKVFSMQIF